MFTPVDRFSLRSFYSTLLLLFSWKHFAVGTHIRHETCPNRTRRRRRRAVFTGWFAYWVHVIFLFFFFGTYCFYIALLVPSVLQNPQTSKSFFDVFFFFFLQIFWFSTWNLWRIFRFSVFMTVPTRIYRERACENSVYTATRFRQSLHSLRVLLIFLFLILENNNK